MADTDIIMTDAGVSASAVSDAAREAETEAKTAETIAAELVEAKLDKEGYPAKKRYINYDDTRDEWDLVFRKEGQEEIKKPYDDMGYPTYYKARYKLYGSVLKASWAELPHMQHSIIPFDSEKERPELVRAYNYLVYTWNPDNRILEPWRWEHYRERDITKLWGELWERFGMFRAGMLLQVLGRTTVKCWMWVCFCMGYYDFPRITYNPITRIYPTAKLIQNESGTFTDVWSEEIDMERFIAYLYLSNRRVHYGMLMRVFFDNINKPENAKTHHTKDNAQVILYTLLSTDWMNLIRLPPLFTPYMRRLWWAWSEHE